METGTWLRVSSNRLEETRIKLGDLWIQGKSFIHYTTAALSDSDGSVKNMVEPYVSQFGVSSEGSYELVQTHFSQEPSLLSCRCICALCVKYRNLLQRSNYVHINHKATKPAFNVGHHWTASKTPFKWCFADGWPAFSGVPSSTKKQIK